VIVDVDENLNLDPERARETVKRGDIVVAVHIYGIPCRIEELERICLQAGAYLVEDVAQAIGGATMGGEGRTLGTFGHASVLSFAGGKILPTNGGGAILTDNQELVDKLRDKIATLPSRPGDYQGRASELRDILTESFNSARRDNPGEASIFQNIYRDFGDLHRYGIGPGEVKEITFGLRRLMDISRSRRYGAWMYTGYLASDEIQNLDYPDGCSPFRYTFLLPGKTGTEVQEITDRIRSDGIHASNLYLPLHWLAPGEVEAGECPRAEMAGIRCINLWVNDDIPERDASRVAKIVLSCL
jgi:dTDP-4-amino-4,6-dideoxygalactose transaminase